MMICYFNKDLFCFHILINEEKLKSLSYDNLILFDSRKEKVLNMIFQAFLGAIMTKRYSVQEREYERARAEMVDRLRKLIRHYSASRVSIPTNIVDDARAYGVSLKGTIYNNAPKDSGDIIVIDYDSSSKWDRFTEKGEDETKGELEQLNHLLCSKNLFQRDFIYAFFDQNHAHEILFRGVYRGTSIISALTLEKTGLGFPVDVESSLVDLLNQAYKDEIKPMVVVYHKQQP